MQDRDFLKKLELKLMSYATRVRDLEAENARLRAEVEEKKKLLAEKK